MSKRIMSLFYYSIKEADTGKKKYTGYIRTRNPELLSLRELHRMLNNLEWEHAQYFNTTMEN